MPSLKDDLNALAKTLEPCILLGARHHEDRAVAPTAGFAVGASMPVEVHPAQVVSMLAGLRVAHDQLIELLASGLGISEAELPAPWLTTLMGTSLTSADPIASLHRLRLPSSAECGFVAPALDQAAF